MKFLLDASALLPLVTRLGRQLIVEARRWDLITTDLAVYEAYNGLWKLSTLLKTISVEEALSVALTIRDLIEKRHIKLVRFEYIDLSRALQVAHREVLTFYDASYIVAAESMEAFLVTEDQKLRKTASKYIKTINFSNFERKLSRK